MVDEHAGAIVVRPGSGLRAGDVEFFALSEHTPLQLLADHDAAGAYRAGAARARR
jgi:hypothetical protein